MSPDKTEEKKPICYENEKHEVYFDKKEKEWICKGHEDELIGQGHNEAIVRSASRLEGLNQGFLFRTIEYKKVSRPLDKRKKIGNEELRKTFEMLKGKELKVSILKLLFKDKIKINDEDTSTTVVSSAIMRRLGKLTGFQWHQERLEGDEGELLIRFIEGPSNYVSPKQRLTEKQKDYVFQKQIHNELEDLESGKSNVESGYTMDDEDGNPYYLNKDEQSENLEYYEDEIKRLEKLLGAKRKKDEYLEELKNSLEEKEGA